MRVLGIALIAVVAACTTGGFMPYEDSNKIHDGSGGIMREVEGVEIWTEGTPPRRFTILGTVVYEVSSVTGSEAIGRAAAAKVVKERGGDAAIQIHNNYSFAGVVESAQNISVQTGIRRFQYAVIRYVR